MTLTIGGMCEMRLIDADEWMKDMLHITTIDGKIPLKVVIAAIWDAPKVPLPEPPEEVSGDA